MRIIAISNQKGGVGKSTLTANIAVCLAAAGFKTLVLELDEQGTSSRQLITKDNPRLGLASYINKNTSLENAIDEGRIPNLWVLAPGADLPTARAALHGSPDMFHCLEQLKTEGRKKFDIVLIDTAGQLNHFIGSALTVATHLITPVFPEAESLSGRATVLQWGDGLIRRSNPTLKYLGTPVIGLNLRRNADHRTIIEELKNDPGIKLFNTAIPFAESGIQAASNRQIPVVLYKGGNTPAAKAFVELTQELIERIEHGKN